MKIGYLLLLGLFLIPLVSAFPCDVTSDPAFCEQANHPDEVYSTLLYQSAEYPNHPFVQQYNEGLAIQRPTEAQTQSSGAIRDAWTSFLSIQPAVYENGILYVPESISAQSEYNYHVSVPQSYRHRRYSHRQHYCGIDYNIQQNDVSVTYFIDGQPVASGKEAQIHLENDSTIVQQTNINVLIEEVRYRWKRWYRWYRCKPVETVHHRSSLTLEDQKIVELYASEPDASITITNEHQDTMHGRVEAENYSYFKLSFEDSELTKQNVYYDLVFDKKPNYVAYLRANEFEKETQRNMYVDGNKFAVNNEQNCRLFAFNHFNVFSEECEPEEEIEAVPALNIEEKEMNLTLLYYVAVFLVLCFVIYKLAHSQFKKVFIPVILILLLVPTVSAAPAEGEEECGITNLASCIPEKLYDFIINIINAPILPTLNFIKSLLTEGINTELFKTLWSIVRYILSFFYIFFFLYAGHVFLFQNADPIRRAHAKDMLKNTILMIVLINGSFYIYGLLIALNSSLSSSIAGLIDPHFFLLTADNIINIGLEFMFAFIYNLTLTFTLILLAIRYVIVAFGVVFFPIGLFLYFIPPLKGYGKFLINALCIFIFITFIDLLIILGCSLLIDIPLFENMKILVMITCFLIVNYTLWLAIKFAIKRSVNTGLKDDFKQAAKYIAMLV